MNWVTRSQVDRKQAIAGSRGPTQAFCVSGLKKKALRLAYARAECLQLHVRIYTKTLEPYQSYSTQSYKTSYLLCKKGRKCQILWCAPVGLYPLARTSLFESAKPPAAAHIQEHNSTKQLVALAASGAVLGPLCDGQHSQFGVLHYTSPSLITVPGMEWHLETCWYCFAFACLLSLCVDSI